MPSFQWIVLFSLCSSRHLSTITSWWCIVVEADVVNAVLPVHVSPAFFADSARSIFLPIIKTKFRWCYQNGLCTFLNVFKLSTALGHEWAPDSKQCCDQWVAESIFYSVQKLSFPSSPHALGHFKFFFFLITVKASNFGLRVNFGTFFFFRRTCYHQNSSHRKMKKMEVVEKL